jgi:hypothetical protein
LGHESGDVVAPLHHLLGGAARRIMKINID